MARQQSPTPITFVVPGQRQAARRRGGAAHSRPARWPGT